MLLTIIYASNLTFTQHLKLNIEGVIMQIENTAHDINKGLGRVWEKSLQPSTNVKEKQSEPPKEKPKKEGVFKRAKSFLGY